MEIARAIAEELLAKSTYIQLCALIMQGGTASHYTNNGFHLIDSFIRTAGKKELLDQGPELLKLIEPLFQTSLKNFPPRKDLNEIANQFIQFQKENPDYRGNGILYGWLNDLIDCKNLSSEPLPSHARVGVNLHAGKIVIEESIILRDAFFFLVLAEQQLEKLLSLQKVGNMALPKDLEEARYERGMIYNSNVGTFSRMSLLNFFSFIEAYVNGIGLDHLYNNGSRLEINERETLTGKKKDKYLSLERKIELYQQIIRPDKKLQMTDPNQCEEPFRSFFRECKEIRDASVHFSALKAPIVRRPNEWIDKVNEYAKITLDLAKKFWDACYSSEKYPNYLDILDYDVHKGLALKRLDNK